jgi:hypothetical protein
MTTISSEAAADIAELIVRQVMDISIEEEQAWASHRYDTERAMELARSLIQEQTNQVWAVQSPRAVEQTALRAHWSLQTRPEYLGF